MKLYLKKIYDDGEEGFCVYNELGSVRYNVNVVTETNRQHIIVTDTDDLTVSEIFNKSFFLRYFTIRCNTGFYVLLPVIRDCFSFRIYGSSYRFAGDLASGRFSLFDVDKSPVMTQKKAWTSYGSGYELEIYVSEDELLALSSAICADMFICSSSEERAYQ